MSKKQSTKSGHLNRTKGYASKAYQTEAKSHYRNQVWGKEAMGLATQLLAAPNDRILVMPSLGGQEIQAAIDAGVPEGRLIACDHKRGVAKAGWRKQFSKVRVFICDVGEVHEKASQAGLRIVAANLDLCAAIGDEVKSVIRRFWGGVETENFILGLSLLKGRGSRQANDELDGYYETPDMDVRLRWALDQGRVVADAHMEVLKAEQYYSGVSPMVWGVFYIEDEDAIFSDAGDRPHVEHATMEDVQLGLDLSHVPHRSHEVDGQSAPAETELDRGAALPLEVDG